jgi:hypothetical protein
MGLNLFQTINLSCLASPKIPGFGHLAAMPAMEPPYVMAYLFHAVEDFILVKHFRENITDAATPGTNHIAIGLRSRDTIDHSSAANRSDG